MAKTIRALAVGVVAVGISTQVERKLAATTLLTDRVDATDGQQPASRDAVVVPTSPRVRGQDPSVAALIQDATSRSTTFRRLVEAVESTDGIVLVERGRCGHYVRTCLAFWIALAGQNRILRVIVDERNDDTEAAISIAHELQHAIEVLSVPSVRTAGAMHGLFERIGTWDGNSFETRAAVKVADAVRSELRKRKPAEVK